MDTFGRGGRVPCQKRYSSEWTLRQAAPDFRLGLSGQRLEHRVSPSVDLFYRCHAVQWSSSGFTCLRATSSASLVIMSCVITEGNHVSIFRAYFPLAIFQVV